jgi:hypothetical protein
MFPQAVKRFVSAHISVDREAKQRGHEDDSTDPEFSINRNPRSQNKQNMLHYCKKIFQYQ